MVQHTAKHLFIHAATLVFLSGGQTFALTPQPSSSSSLLARTRRIHESPPTLSGSALLRESKLASVQPRTGAPLMAAADAAGSKGSTVTASVINLSKNIVGSGILALAGGVAAFSASPYGIIPALAVLFFLGAASGYSFSLIARVGDETGAETYRDTWAKVFGENTSLLPALTVLFKTFVGGLSYAIILGDSFSSIATLAGLPPALARSNTWIYLLSAFVLLPLSLMRDLSSLAVGSIIGTAGTVYTALFVWFRKFDASYAVGGKFYELIAESSRPAFAAATAARPLVNPSIFVLISMLATAFLAHYNAPKYYKELAAPADGSSKQKAFNLVCAGAFGIASLLCAAVMAGGYLTFGGASQGLILNSYATADPLALLARLGICASIIFSYPLNFVGLREGVLNLFKLDGAKSSVHVTTTLLLLCAMNGVALVLKNLGLVVAVGGAALGTSLVYTFPALMFIQATRLKRKELQAKGSDVAPSRLREMYLNMALVALGLSLGGVGVVMSLKSVGGH